MEKISKKGSLICQFLYRSERIREKEREECLVPFLLNKVKTKEIGNTEAGEEFQSSPA